MSNQFQNPNSKPIPPSPLPAGGGERVAAGPVRGFGIWDFRQRRRFGFSLVDLLVAATIIIVISSFVLAGFRSGQRTGELDLALKQIISGITEARNKSFSGQLLVNSSFPDGGYGISFDLTKNDQYELFAVLDLGREPLPSGIKKFNQIEFVSFFGTTQSVVAAPPPGAIWEDAGGLLEMIFVSPQEIIANPPTNGLGQPFQYVGGIIQHKKTGQQAYFYVSLVSGLVTGDTL